MKSSYNYGYLRVNPLMHYMGTSNSILLYSYHMGQHKRIGNSVAISIGFCCVL